MTQTVPIYDISLKNRSDFLQMHSAVWKLPAIDPERFKYFDHRYAVSTEGRVYDSLDKKMVPIFKAGIGYACVQLHNDKLPRTVHSYVQETFRPKAKLPFPGYYTMVDHINPHNKMDARLCNLRWSNASLNGMNKAVVKGYEKRSSGRYTSSLRISGKATHLGTFNSPEEALKRRAECLERAYEILEQY